MVHVEKRLVLEIMRFQYVHERLFPIEGTER